MKFRSGKGVRREKVEARASWEKIHVVVGEVAVDGEQFHACVLGLLGLLLPLLGAPVLADDHLGSRTVDAEGLGCAVYAAAVEEDFPEKGVALLGEEGFTWGATRW
jgi:hypothetical protein